MNLSDDERLEEKLGIRFKNRALLNLALTHSSVVPDLRAGHGEDAGIAAGIGNNERLEFLGDAVLDLLASEYLLENFPDWTEGQLSKSRARLVNARSLERAARRLGLGEHLRLGRGEEKTGGRDKPALLADGFEAVVAAVFLDAGRIDLVSADADPQRLYIATGNKLLAFGLDDGKSIWETDARLPNTASRAKVAPTTEKSLLSKCGRMGSALAAAKAKQKKKPSNRRRA